jgi:hypothetical protein
LPPGHDTLTPFDKQQLQVQYVSQQYNSHNLSDQRYFKKLEQTEINKIFKRGTEISIVGIKTQ